MQPLWLCLHDLSDAERVQASTAIREALDALPEGTPERDLAAAREHALKHLLDRRAERKRRE